MPHSSPPPPSKLPRPGAHQARFVTDAQGIVADANLHACLMIDLGRRFMIGKPLALFVDREDTEKLDDLLHSLGPANRAKVTLRLRNRVGRVQPVRLEGAFVNADHVHWSARPIGP
jgi:PAS domain-containing protein